MNPNTLYETKIAHRSGYLLWSIQKFLIYMQEVNFRNLYGVYVVAESSWEGGETSEILFIFVVHAAEGATFTFCLIVLLMMTSNLRPWALGLVSYR